MEDFKLVKKIGKEGEGPGEFKIRGDLAVKIDIQKDRFLVNSLGKVSIFNRKGIMEREMRVSPYLSIHWIKCILN